MKRFLFNLIVLLFCSNSFALDLVSVNVFAEDDAAEARQCNHSNSSTVAAVESVFRQNRIKVDSNSPYYVYINTAILEIRPGYCSVSTRLFIYFTSNVNIPDKKFSKFLRTELCTYTSLLIGNSGTISSRINNDYRSFAEECISKIEKK
jgi:hypothetical protein